MRALLTFAAGLAMAAILAAVGILALQNPQGEQLDFLGATVLGTAGLDVAAGATLGFVAALLLLLPGQVASTLHNATLGRKLKALEGRMAPLREQLEKLKLDHIRLQDDYRCLQDEALRLRSAVAQWGGPSAAAAIAAAPRNPAEDAKEARDAEPAAAAGVKAPDPKTASRTGESGLAGKGDASKMGGTGAAGGAQGGGASGPGAWWAKVTAKIEATFGGESADGDGTPAKAGTNEPEWRRTGGPWQA
jgi:hypothetical protein